MHSYSELGPNNAPNLIFSDKFISQSAVQEAQGTDWQHGEIGRRPGEVEEHGCSGNHCIILGLPSGVWLVSPNLVTQNVIWPILHTVRKDLHFV